MENLKEALNITLKAMFGKNISEATPTQLYYALSKALMIEFSDEWRLSLEKSSEQKQAFYLSAEFLMGRALGNNLINLGKYKSVISLLNELDLDINLLESAEEDPGLGNGGLGRLAACFLESGASMGLPLHGYGIRYHYGLFRQKFEDGFQVEYPDDWLRNPDPWSIRKDEDQVIVHFEDGDVLAVPYDTPIIGYQNQQINTLRLWQSEPLKAFDFEAFNNQDYDLAVADKNVAESICKVLYPNDSKDEGKILRLKQQYFFVSASLQDLVRKFLLKGEPFENFPKYYAIQLNDTHPVVAIPELLRILMDEHDLRFNHAFKIVQSTFAYTNHTILQEALEKWHIGFYKKIIPRVFYMLQKIDRHFLNDLKESEIPHDQVQSMRMIHDHMIHMAYLAIYGSHSTNGVAALHTDILKNSELKDWYDMFPERFNNKTNGITQRRWLKYANPQLSRLITTLLGSEDWTRDLKLLNGLQAYVEDEEILKRFMRIKSENKKNLADYIEKTEGVRLNHDALFDIQIKRLHEYKRQLLNAFHIMYRYFEIKENPNIDYVPRVFIFGAKAAPGYFRAKGIIKYINEIAKKVNEDPDVNHLMQVHFVENYNVSYGEKLFVAADLSEQISTAGKEASGTGNMKFMLNGTPTIGTLDGANVEIIEEAGIENNFIFGARVEEIEALKDTYNPVDVYLTHPKIKRVVDTLINGTFSDGETGMFHELYSAIMEGASWHKPDNYFILYDFLSYVEAHEAVDSAYKDTLGWAKKCWLNLSNAGKFSSDRTIMQYAKEIWDIHPVELSK